MSIQAMLSLFLNLLTVFVEGNPVPKHPCQAYSFERDGECHCKSNTRPHIENGKQTCIPCPLCNPANGEGLMHRCDGTTIYTGATNLTCQQCPDGFYSNEGTCEPCRKECLISAHEIPLQKCAPAHDLLCGCAPTLHRNPLTGRCSDKCSLCFGPHQKKVFRDECLDMPKNMRCRPSKKKPTPLSPITTFHGIFLEPRSKITVKNTTQVKATTNQHSLKRSSFTTSHGISLETRSIRTHNNTTTVKVTTEKHSLRSLSTSQSSPHYLDTSNISTASPSSSYSTWHIFVAVIATLIVTVLLVIVWRRHRGIVQCNKMKTIKSTEQTESCFLTDEIGENTMIAEIGENTMIAEIGENTMIADVPFRKMRCDRGLRVKTLFDNFSRKYYGERYYEFAEKWCSHINQKVSIENRLNVDMTHIRNFESVFTLLQHKMVNEYTTKMFAEFCFSNQFSGMVRELHTWTSASDESECYETD